MGGCALNALANTKVRELFDDVWIMPNPGDAGSSLGAASSLYGSHLNWKGPYLGHNIKKPYEIDKTLEELLSYGVSEFVGGRAEFGPRALGNRSLLADPRDESIKEKVNLIKKRELFRPFAPVVLEEYASEWFEMDFTSPYMQYIVKVKKPELIPSVVHVDGTARVQTVNGAQHPELYSLLLRWHKRTGVPVLLNTSLNIKNQPILNDEYDLQIWKNLYK
jgi:carbamoyltransferase